MRRTKKTVATPSLFSVRGCVPGLHCLRLPVEPDKHPRSLHGRQPLHQLGFERFCRCRLLSYFLFFITLFVQLQIYEEYALFLCQRGARKRNHVFHC